MGRSYGFIEITGVVQHYVIPNPEPGTEKMLKISALDKD